MSYPKCLYCGRSVEAVLFEIIRGKILDWIIIEENAIKLEKAARQAKSGSQEDLSKYLKLRRELL